MYILRLTFIHFDVLVDKFTCMYEPTYMYSPSLLAIFHL